MGAVGTPGRWSVWERWCAVLSGAAVEVGGNRVCDNQKLKQKQWQVSFFKKITPPVDPKPRADDVSLGQ